MKTIEDAINEFVGEDINAIDTDNGEALAGSWEFENDLQYAELFVQRHGENVRFISEERRWLLFEPLGGWARTPDDSIIGLFAQFSAEVYGRLLQNAVVEAGNDRKKAAHERATRSLSLGNMRRIEPAMELVRCNAAVAIHADQLDTDTNLAGVANGIVNMTTGEFFKWDRSKLVTRRLAADFDPTATAPHFHKFLARVQPDAEVRDFLQRLCGYSLTGHVSDHYLPFHYGIGANGKGTLLEQVILAMSGTYGRKLTDKLVYTDPRGAAPDLEIAGLCGARFALGEENGKGGSLNERFLKSATGGDKQKGRFHYQDFLEFWPTAKIALVGNHKPKIAGTDDGIWRRFILIDWKVQIPEGERDRTLAEKLKDEFPGILNWMIEGAVAWKEAGLRPPESCRIATNSFRSGSDELANFILDCFSQDRDAYSLKSDVFDEYKAWASLEGLKANDVMTKRALGQRLIERGWNEGKAGHGRDKVWVGWKLNRTFGLPE